MRGAWQDWDAAMPRIPEDARVELLYTHADMP